MAFAWLAEAFGEPRPVPRLLSGHVDEARWTAMADVLGSAAVSPATTSMGRLFDAVAALCGIAPRTSYEGQAAVELEAAAARSPDRNRYEFLLDPGWTIDPRDAVRAAVADLEAGVSVPTVAARVHNGVADVTIRACVAVAAARGLGSVVLSGGVFQNRLLLEAVAGGLAAAGLRTLIPLALPPNDGGISFGQAAVAAARGGGGRP